MTTTDWVELIKAIGSAVGAIVGAVGLAYARIAAKRSREASEQTKTTSRVDGLLTDRTAAEDAAEALYLVNGLVPIVREIRAELASPGSGRRRAGQPHNPEEYM